MYVQGRAQAVGTIRLVWVIDTMEGPMNSLLLAGACHCVFHHGPHGAHFISNPRKLMTSGSLWRGLMHRGWPNVNFRGYLYSASVIHPNSLSDAARYIGG